MGFTAIIAALLGRAAVDAYSAHRATRALAVLSAKSTVLRSEIRATRQEISEADRDSARLRAAMAAPGTATAPPYRLRSVTRITDLERLAIAATEPRLRELSIRALRAGLPQRFGPLIRALNLDAGQVGRLESIEVRHWEAQIGIVAAAAAQGIPADDPSVDQLLRGEAARTQAAQEALLGDEGFRQLQQFDRSQPLMDVVDSVANSVAVSATPLTASQQDQLLRILANSSPEFLGGGTATTSSIDWSAALPQAGAILLPSQYPALEAVYDQIALNRLASQFYSRPRAGE